VRAAQATIRAATVTDVCFVEGLSGRLADHSRLPWLPVEATDRFAAAGCRLAAAAIGDPSQLVLIAERDGDPVGFLHARLETSAFTSEQVGYVSTVVVAPAAARQGTGRRLLEGAEAWARAQGCRLLTLEVFGANASARAVYERLGYREQTLKLAKELRPPPT
jgi:GNAT superfamily N-acetyltransferase